MKTSTNKTLNIILWVAQIGLAGMFIMAGVMKTFTPISELAVQQPWANDLPGLVRFIGITELLGGIGLILPILLNIKPFLTPLSALGIALIMLFAIGFHVTRGEFGAVSLNLLLCVAALFIAWGRTRKVPVLARA